MKLTSHLPCLALIVLMSACGGGGDTATPTTAANTATPTAVATTPTVTTPALTDKYTATWKSCRSDGLLRTLVITKKSENSYAVAFKATAHNGGYPCAGEGTAIPDGSGVGEFKIVGTKEISGSTSGTVDKIVDSVSGDKNIFFITTVRLNSPRRATDQALARVTT
jgi:hypothetical protein